MEVPFLSTGGSQNEESKAPSARLSLIPEVRCCTPARIFAGHSGPAYSTGTQLELRRDHAAAVDAVHAELCLTRDFAADFIEAWNLFLVCSRAQTRTEFLLRPDLGRRLDEGARAEIVARCNPGADLQIIIGDGLSVAAIASQVPALLSLLAKEAESRGWSFGQPVLVRHCRVGILNDVGDLLNPSVVVLLIGERPGLATAESLSAYMAYRPQMGHTDAQRNLISNMHARGVSSMDAAKRIVALAETMRAVQASGVGVKEKLADSASRNPLLSSGSHVGGIPEFRSSW